MHNIGIIPHCFCPLSKLKTILKNIKILFWKKNKIETAKNLFLLEKIN